MAPYLTTVFSFAILVLALFPGDAFSRPDPQPKSDWVRARQRKGMIKGIKRWTNDTWSSPSSSPSCSDNHALGVTAPKTNIWGGLSDIEAASVTRWLFSRPELNLTTTDDAGEWDNSILLVELMQPNKTDALSYIDGSGTAPARWAHVMLDKRATTNPTYDDILVGPLPIQNGSTSWQPLDYPYTRKTQGQIRNLDADSDTTMQEWLWNTSSTVQDITLDLWDGTAIGADNDTLDIWGIDPLWQDDGRVIRWDTFWNFPTDEFDAETLLPLGLYFKSDVTGRDPSQWKQLGWLYNNIYYETTEQFRAAYYSPGFVKNGPNVEGDWARSDQQGPVLPQDTMYPPTAIAPSGSRYSVDTEQKYVEWMDFSFYVSFSRDTGMALHDIRYKGERILYELGLQEALAHYAGNDPVQSGTSYLDSYYGFGPYAFELVKGYDCPSYATYLNSSFYVSETTHTHLNSICLFEFDADFPIQRHSTSQYVSVSKNVYFTIRSVSTVGNYDYMFSYTFSMDGSVEVAVRASGYIQSAYYAHNEDYGYQIHDALSGSMHDHVLNYKADFDILGTDNSMQLTTFVPVKKSYPWSGNQTRNTMQIQRRILANEDESRLTYDGNGATQYRVVNTDKPNKYGQYRGYRILPSAGTIHLTVEDSSNLKNAANWAKYDLAVSQHKDTEPRSAHPYNSQDVANPMIDFDKFFDGESLEQEDLVVWFNLGMHHLPNTGDLPNTVFTTAHSGVQFMPVNYLLGDPSRETVNQVRINYVDGNVTSLETFGQKDAICQLNFEPVEPDLSQYHGDVVIRKFPFDPNNPYFETDSIT